MVYTAMNRSLAMAEVAVHLSLAMLPEDYRMITIDIPDRVSRHQLAPNRLPAGWKAFPHPAATRAIGDRFIAEGKHCILIVPSAITQGDFNYLLNPRHPDFKKIRIRKVEAFPFDRRMVR
ncbi:MAG TPA: RES family NAD+ phosphorylase, partial [Bacteroidia bacterium]|nr:RES family NAD+ phosphorylase [Bacteroidia bacterium]